MINIKPDNFNQVNNSIYGNPRYALHYLQILTDQEQKNSIFRLYEYALNKAKRLNLGCKKFHNKQYGGGLVFETYNLKDLCDRLNEKLNKEQ